MWGPARPRELVRALVRALAMPMALALARESALPRALARALSLALSRAVARTQARALAADQPPRDRPACVARETAKPLGAALLKATRWLVAGRGRQSLRTPGRWHRT